MPLLQKIFQRFTDPLFYKKRIRGLVRGFRSFDDKTAEGLEQFQGIAQMVVVLAHPDDEVFCSGLICEMVHAGVRVRILCMTKGEGGPCGDFPREQLGHVRSEEMKRSCETLGVEELIFLGHIDPVGQKFKVYAPDVSVEEFADQLRPHLMDAELIVSHGSSGEYWHPGHILVHQAVSLFLEKYPTDQGPSWLSFSARRSDHPMPDLVNWDDPAYLTLDGTRYERTRCRSLSCHKTQLELFSKFASGDHLDFIRYTALENYALKHPGVRLRD